MCSVYEEGETHQPMKADVSLMKKECMKCKKNVPQVVIRVNDAFCRECFLQYCTHKFRSAFGKSKVIRDGEKVLVAFSGGQASTAMLHLIMEGKSVRAQKKLRFIPALIYIDEGAALGLSEGCSQTKYESVEQIFSALQYSFHMVKLEQLFSNMADSDSTATNSTPAVRLKKLFSSLQTATAKEQMIKTLRRELLIEVAKAEGYTKVLVGDTSSRLSMTILSNMAMGKGAHIAYDTSLLDDRDADVCIVRPMKDFTNKEAAMYNRFNSLEAEVLPTFTTKQRNGASVDRLTESFVSGLQAGFPSTVSTIMRTGEKLMNSKQDLGDDGDDMDRLKCVICKAPLDTAVPKSSALESVRHAQVLSERRLIQNGLDLVNFTKPSLMVEISCFSCQQMLRDLSDPELLPPSLSTSKTNRTAMREAIQDSLL